MIWQLLQVSKLHDTPLILVGKMWAELVDWSKTYMLRAGLPAGQPGGHDDPRCVKTGRRSIALIREHHAEWKKRQA